MEIFLNDGSGKFGLPPSSFFEGNLPVSLATADFNDDNFIDIVIADAFSDKVRVLLNDGLGNFDNQSNFFAGDQSVFVTIGDFDNDGDIDLATPSLSKDVINLMANNGNAEFTLIGTISTTKPQVPTFQDINGDGNLDLITGNSLADNNDTISVFANNGGGNFNLIDTIELPVESSISKGIDFGDFDLIVADGSGVGRKQHVFLNDGLGQFTFKASFTVDSFQALAKDLNQDGIPEIISSRGIFFSIP